MVLLFTVTSLTSVASAKELNELTPEEVKMFSSDALLKRQQMIEEKILAEYKRGNYTLENPLIKVDPFGSAPLSALVIFDTAEPTRVDLLVKGKTANVDIEHSFKEYCTHHEIPVYGLYENYNNEVVITVYTKDGLGKRKTLNIVTAPLPDNGELDARNVKVTVKNESQMADGLTFTITSGKQNYASVVAYDANGDIRSVLTEVGWVTPVRRLDNGRILVFSNKNHRGYYQMSFYEMDLLGKVYKEYLRNGIHHDVRKLSNGNYLVVCEKAGRDTTEDFIVELDGKTGMKVREWDMKEIFKMKNYIANPHYHYNEDWITHDWLHVNSVWPIPGEDAILFSPRHQDGFFKLDLGKSEIVWAMTAPDEDFSDELSSKLLTPIGDDFEYVWGQHAISMLPDGKIFVYDNGCGRSKDANEQWTTSDPRNYSRAVIYYVDEKNMTVEQLWQYGKERGTELYSSSICDVDYLGQYHYLIDFGGAREGPDRSIRKATIVEVKDDEVVWEMKLNAGIYRVERIPAYEFDKEYELTKHPGEQFGVLFTTEDNTI